MSKPNSLAESLNELFHSVRHPQGREYTHTEVAEEVARRTNGELSIDPSSIGKIRAGHVKNPGVKIIAALALFFGVDTDYFFPELARLRGSEQRHTDDAEIQLALRSIGMSPSVREHLTAIIRALSAGDREQDTES